MCLEFTLIQGRVWESHLCGFGYLQAAKCYKSHVLGWTSVTPTQVLLKVRPFSVCRFTGSLWNSNNINLNDLLLIYPGFESLPAPPENMDLSLCLPLLVMLLQPALCVYNCSTEYDRTPGMCNQPGHCSKPVHRISKFLFSALCFLDNSDLTVECGTTVITLEVNLCSAKWAGFNATDLALNGNHNISDCLGSVDTSVDPPVVRYHLPVNHSQDNSCRQSLQVREGQGATPKTAQKWRQTRLTIVRIFVLSHSDSGWSAWPSRAFQQLLDYPVGHHHRVHRHAQVWPGTHQLLYGPPLPLLLPIPAGVSHQ